MYPHHKSELVITLTLTIPKYFRYTVIDSKTEQGCNQSDSKTEQGCNQSDSKTEQGCNQSDSKTGQRCNQITATHIIKCQEIAEKMYNCHKTHSQKSIWH